MPVDANRSLGANPASVTGAIRTASKATGVSFDYLLATAKVESDLNPNLTVRTSTATGLFQFLEQTWLATLKQAGPALGYGNYAAAITKSSSGRYEVANPALRNEIMQLRKDPMANAVMGGAVTQLNAAALAKRIGHTPSEGELYIAHFFGPYAGAKAINLAAGNPNADAAEIFPAAARANRPIFYDKQGHARSVAGVCAELARRYQVARASSSAAAIQVAAVPPRPPAAIPNAPPASTAGRERSAAPALPVAATLRELMFSPTPLPTAMAYASEPSARMNVLAAGAPSPAGASPAARTDTAAPGFHSLFHSVDRREAVSPVVSELWSGQAAPKTAQMAQTVQASLPSMEPSNDRRAAGSGSTLDLFRDTRPNVQALFDGKA